MHKTSDIRAEILHMICLTIYYLLCLEEKPFVSQSAALYLGISTLCLYDLPLHMVVRLPQLLLNSRALPVVRPLLMHHYARVLPTHCKQGTAGYFSVELM